ncbi:MAG: methionine--tRNA ligase [Verrucomicrobiota bacterium]
MSTFYITTPIYYVNDLPHIGHAYTTLLADVLARYHRMLGDETFFLTGTDEHGQKVQEAAQARGVSEQVHVDETVQRFQELWEKLEITNDDFVRTTQERHTRVVQGALQDLFDRDEIYKAEYDGWYDVKSETFVTEKDLDLAEGQSPDELPHIKRIKEANYFFRMGKYQQWLIDYIKEHPSFIQPDFRRNETLGFLENQALTDLCISRPKTRLSWGIELPFDADYVTYVWFDALVNYISVPGYLRDEEMFNRWWPAEYHLIGKDILTTHTVYWPTMLKAMGLPLPKTVFAHGWWLSGKDKMSKSDGNVVNPMDYVEAFGVDPFRYFLMAEMALGQDASFTHEKFVKRYNADLANDLGNLSSRVLKMIKANCDGRIPEVPADALDGAEEKALWAATQAAVSKMEETLEAMRLDLGINEVLTAVRACNKYLEQRAPWKQAKEDDKTPLYQTMYTAAEVLRVVSSLLFPVMPAKMRELRVALGLGDAGPDIEHARQWGVLVPGTEIGPPGILFPRHVEEKKQEPPMQEKNVENTEGVQDVSTITLDDFTRVELKTAEILTAERIEDAEKLLKLQVKVGEETRQLVAGIALHYAAEDLPGRKIVIVANLKPRKVFGVMSEGMLLAARLGDNLRLVTVDGEQESGARVG